MPAGDVVIDDDVVAWFERTVDEVYRAASRLTGGDLVWTDELVREAYLGVLHRTRAGEVAALDVGALAADCRRRFVDQRRRGRRRAPSGERPATTAFDRLTTDQRLVTVLVHVDGLPVAAAADDLGRSVDDTAALLAGAAERLRAASDEGDIVAAVRSSGHRPSPSSRAEIRSALRSDVALEVSEDRRPTTRPTWRSRRFLGAAVVVAAAVSVGVIVAAGDDEDARRPPATSVPAPDTTTSGGVTLQDLTGERWILESSEGDAWTGIHVPYLEFQEDQPIVRGSDGCARLSTRGAIDDAVLAFTALESVGPLDCPSVGGPYPAEGELLRSAPLGRLEVVDASGAPRLTYVAASTLATPNDADLIGTFAGSDADEAVHFGPGGVAELGRCAGTFTLGAWLRVYGIDAVDACNPADDAGTAAVLDLLVKERSAFASAKLDAAGDLLLGDDDDVVRLRRVSWSDDQPAISVDDRSVYGLVTNRQVDPDDVVAALEPFIGRPTADSGWGAIPTTRGDDGRLACRAGQQARELWWGDVRVDFTRLEGPRITVVQTWSVGDARVSGRAGVAGPSSGARTADGLGLWSPVADLAALGVDSPAAGAPFEDGTTLLDPQLDAVGDATLRVATRNGRVTGTGVVAGFC